jgi:ABC-type glycerol-3-phosphate transport system substrate-binding protein
MTLTVWTTEAFSPTQVITTGRLLAQQVATFEALRPDVRIRFLPKEPYGKGGILDYLLTTQPVVPELLPDLVVIDVDELPAAVQAGLLQPLDDLLPSDLVADLYPSARRGATFGEGLYGLQYEADLEHLVYDTGQTAVPPSSWPGVLSSQGPYLFAAGGQSGLVNDAFLIQYLAIRPWPPVGSPDEPFLEINSLAAVLQYYQDGASRGIFPADVLNYRTAEDAWRDYVAGRANMAQANAHHYLVDRERRANSAAAPIPGINGPAAPLNRGWVLALVAPEPARQSAAAEFMALIMSLETNAAWNRAAGFLPTRQAALALWDPGNGYAPFVHQQLQIARPRPVIPNYAAIADAVQQAVEDVLSGAAAPEEAAAQAIETTQ